ncbi:hypothetical protein DOY81_014956, partial [Sarcophaga bullata]
MALQINSFINISKQLPLTIIPITEDALNNKSNGIANNMPTSTQKPPDLTFHCMCCEEYFISPFLMYEHLNTKHADLPEPQEPEEELEDDKDYSWVFEPVCELVAPEDGGQIVNGQKEEEEDEDSESEQKRQYTNGGKWKKEAAYEEVEGISLHSQNSQANAIHLKVADPRESTSIILLNTPKTEPGIPPIMAQPVKRGRGRRSAAQQAAIEMSSLICGEPKCFQCSHCEASFPSAGDLSKHVRCHITNKPFQCSICEKTFTHIGSLNTHIRIHSGEKPYKCELCSKAFTQSSSLMVHVRSHSVKKPHQCHLCDKGFVNSTSLVIHLKTHKDGAHYACSE